MKSHICFIFPQFTRIFLQTDGKVAYFHEAFFRAVLRSLEPCKNDHWHSTDGGASSTICWVCTEHSHMTLNSVIRFWKISRNLVCHENGQPYLQLRFLNAYAMSSVFDVTGFTRSAKGDIDTALDLRSTTSLLRPHIDVKLITYSSFIPCSQSKNLSSHASP